MKFVSDFETGKKVILAEYPEFENAVFKFDNSGWTNFVIWVNDKYIFRFPKNQMAYDAIAKENLILEHLNQKMPSHIKVPKYIFKGLNKDFPYIGYEAIRGTFLSKEIFGSFSKTEKEKVTSCMAEFLNTLHSIDFSPLGLKITDTKKKYSTFYEKIKDDCFPYFDEELKEKTNHLFLSFLEDETMHNFNPTLIHGDLSFDHILITENGVGIIDFGDLMVFDPAYDFIWAYKCEKEFFEEIFNRYKKNKDAFFEHRIRDFYVKRTPYHGILYANENKDTEMRGREILALRKNLLK